MTNCRPKRRLICHAGPTTSATRICVILIRALGINGIEKFGQFRR